MGPVGKVEPLAGPVPRVSFNWDAQTEILSGSLSGVGTARGFTGTIELAGASGAVVTLEVASGVVQGLAVVVWPTIEQISDLVPPASDWKGRLMVPARPSQPGIAAHAIDVPLSAKQSAGGAVICLGVGEGSASEVVALADKLLVELDGDGELVGFWLLDVPPFPATENYR